MRESAGLSIPSILAAMDARGLSLDFLDSPALELPEPLPLTYREFAKEQGNPVRAPPRHPGGDGVRGAGSGRSRRPGRRETRGARADRARHRCLRGQRSAPLRPVFRHVFRDGDVYGRTVNIASRIADEAEAGEVLTSQETTEETAGDAFIRFERSRTTHLKGVANPMTLYRVFRAS